MVEVLRDGAFVEMQDITSWFPTMFYGVVNL